MSKLGPAYNSSGRGWILILSDFLILKFANIINEDIISFNGNIRWSVIDFKFPNNPSIELLVKCFLKHNFSNEYGE